MDMHRTALEQQGYTVLPDVLSPQLQSLLGYSSHPPCVGQVTACYSRRALDPGFVAPVLRDHQDTERR